MGIITPGLKLHIYNLSLSRKAYRNPPFRKH